MELQDEAGRWYKLRVRPFTTHDKKVDGVVMTLLDIDDMKRTMERLRLSQSFSDAIIDTVREPLLVLDPGLRVLVANRSFYRYFRVSSSETEGNYIYNLGKGQWDIPELRRLLEEILPNNTSFDDFVIEKKFPHLGMKRLILNARKVQPEEDRQAEGKILLAIEEHRGEP
jgi:two-component system CheB/CheR fusion protein